MPHNPLLLRDLDLTDLPAAAAIHRLCFPDSWDEIALGQLFDLPTTRHLGAYALPAHQLRGFMLIQVIKESAEILTFAVDPAHQNAGIGGQLLDMVLERLTHLDVQRVFLEVSVENSWALHLYKKRGFVTLATRPRYYVDRADPTALVLQKVF